MFEVRLLIAFIILMICAIEDFYTGYVNTLIIASGTILAVISEILLGEITQTNINLHIQNIISGVLLLTLMLAVKGIGEGDTFIAASLCIIVGFYDTLGIMFISFILAAIYALYLKLFRKEEDRYGFPFVPFIAGGFVIRYIPLLMLNLI